MYSCGEKLDDLLLNLVVVFEARRIEGMTLFQAGLWHEKLLTA